MNYPSSSNVFSDRGFWYLEFEGESRIDFVDPEYYAVLERSRSLADRIFWADRALKKGKTYETHYETPCGSVSPV